MDKALNIVLKDIALKLDRTNFAAKNKDKYKDQINSLMERYNNIEVSDNRIETYNSLVKKGRELLKDNIKEESKLKYYLKYCEAATYDFQGITKPLTLLIRMFLVSIAIFLVLAPQYFGPIFPLIFLVPVYLGLKGMKKRVVNGLMLSMAVMPMTLLSSAVCIRMSYLASTDFANYIANAAKNNNITETMAKYFAIGSGIFGVILLITSIITIYIGYKYRKMFV